MLSLLRLTKNDMAKAVIERLVSDDTLRQELARAYFGDEAEESPKKAKTLLRAPSSGGSSEELAR